MVIRVFARRRRRYSFSMPTHASYLVSIETHGAEPADKAISKARSNGSACHYAEQLNHLCRFFRGDSHLCSCKSTNMVSLKLDLDETTGHWALCHNSLSLLDNIKHLFRIRKRRCASNPYSLVSVNAQNTGSRREITTPCSPGLEAGVPRLPAIKLWLLDVAGALHDLFPKCEVCGTLAYKAVITCCVIVLKATVAETSKIDGRHHAESFCVIDAYLSGQEHDISRHKKILKISLLGPRFSTLFVLKNLDRSWHRLYVTFIADFCLCCWRLPQPGYFPRKLTGPWVELIPAQSEYRNAAPDNTQPQGSANEFYLASVQPVAEHLGTADNAVDSRLSARLYRYKILDRAFSETNEDTCVRLQSEEVRVTPKEMLKMKKANTQPAYVFHICH